MSGEKTEKSKIKQSKKRVFGKQVAEVGRGSALEISESEQKSAQFGGRKWLWRNSERENKKKRIMSNLKSRSVPRFLLLAVADLDANRINCGFCCCY